MCLAAGETVKHLKWVVEEGQFQHGTARFVLTQDPSQAVGCSLRPGKFLLPAREAAVHSDATQQSSGIVLKVMHFPKFNLQNFTNWRLSLGFSKICRRRFQFDLESSTSWGYRERWHFCFFEGSQLQMAS